MVHTRAMVRTTPTNRYTVAARNARRVIRTVRGIGAVGRTARRLLWPKKKSYPKRRKTVNQREKDLLEISTHNDLSMHKLPRFVMKKALKGNFSGMANHQENYQQIFACPQGKQCAGFAEVLFSRGKLIGATAPTVNVRTQAAIDYYQLNPQAGNTGSTKFPSVSGIRNDNAFLGVQSANIKMEFLSMQSVAQTVDLYFLMPKYDCGQDPIESWKDYLAAEALGLPAVTGKTTYADLTPQEGGVNNENWGTDPFKTYHFQRMWKCLKKVSFVLQPGDQRNYEFPISYNKVAKRGTFIHDRIAGDYIAGWSIVPFFIIKGGLVGLSADGLTSVAGEVGHSSTRVGVVATIDYKFKFPVDSPRYVKWNQIDTTQGLTIPEEVQIDVDDEKHLMQEV